MDRRTNGRYPSVQNLLARDLNRNYKDPDEVFPFYPTDLLNGLESIKRNIIKGPYASVEHYIETHLCLLKEDFETRLRAGIGQFLENPEARNHDIWVYEDVTVDMASEKENFKISLTSEDSRKFSWEKSDRFLYGSMVIVAKKNFRDFDVAIVRDRGNLQSIQNRIEKKYYIYVEFMMAPSCNDQNDRYLLIEPKVFFEPYHQVMMALESFRQRKFLPMVRYLVYVETSRRLPTYLTYASEYTIDHSIVRLNKDTGWPSAESMALNESQRKAIMSALNNQMVLIQGPPGTGKTYLVYKLIKYLLDNNDFSSPIMVVCYKNHSLDQLLEGLLDRSVSLLRLGSQSKSEKLKEFNLAKVRVQFSGRRVFEEIDSRLTENGKKLRRLWNEINLLKMKRGIIHIKSLTNFNIISPNVLAQFSENKPLHAWLLEKDLYSDNSISLPTADQISAMTKLDSSSRLLYSHSLDEIIEEIAYLRTEFDKLEVASNKKPLNKDQHAKLIEIVVHFESPVFSFNILQTCLHRYEKIWIDTIDESTVQSLEATADLHSLSMEDRWTIYRFWERKLLKQIEINYEKAMSKQFSLKEENRKLKDMIKIRKIETVRPQVLGMTTSGAAAHHRILEEIASPVVIVEEAAEVLESHIVASLSKSCQHLILIGDHEQLKPSTASHVLAENNKMDVSLFERMINNGARCDVLTVQNRMRPEISALICPSIYPNLENDPSVLNHPDVCGVAKNVLFFHHGHPEAILDSESRFNPFEGDFALALSLYLMKQDSFMKDPGRITILTAYKEQEHYIMKEHRRLGLDLLRKLHITSIDNYQGEENDVVILSLVRNNPEGNVGFLDTKNRVCVALSRAKQGLYILGNFDCLVKKRSSIWRKIAEVLYSQQAKVVDFPLKCKTHGNVTLVKEVNEISALEYGGCLDKCQLLLDCGHRCQRDCHGYDMEHKQFKCQASCTKKCPQGHLCTEICSFNCPPCQVTMQKKLPCLHTEEVPCCELSTNDHCKQYVTRYFEKCGHNISTLCRESHKCNMPCDENLPCGHTCPRICHVEDDPLHHKSNCEEQCTKINITCPEEHQCTRPCYEDCGSCIFQLTRVLPCSHRIIMECSRSIEEVMCQNPCERILPECEHVCKNKCCMPCGPCTLLVDYTMPCSHMRRSLCGSEGFALKNCLENCTLKKDCGHDCSGQCKDDCKKVKCTVKVSVTIPCGHAIEIDCHEREASLDVMLGWCTSPCSKFLPECGHQCKGTCGLCLQGRVHKGCQEVCNKPLRCDHKCKALCDQLYHSCNESSCALACWGPVRHDCSIEIGRLPSTEQEALDLLNKIFMDYLKQKYHGKIGDGYDEPGAFTDFTSKALVIAFKLRIERKENITSLMSHIFLLEFVNVALQIVNVTNRYPQYSTVSNCLESIFKSILKRDLHHLTWNEISQVKRQMNFLKWCLYSVCEAKCMLDLWNDSSMVNSFEQFVKSYFPTTEKCVMKIIHHAI